jgi:hypothetical protein
MGNSSSSNKTAEGSISKAQQPSYYTMIKNSYQQLINAIIRPPRCIYEVSQLGPASFNFGGKMVERTDFEVRNSRGHKLMCSWWQFAQSDRPCAAMPCVIYMHGNSSSRLEAISSLSLVLTLRASMVSFDFSGSGQSDGQYVSLGFFEKDDLQVLHRTAFC